MGELDREIRNYLSNKAIFADVVNYRIFAGKAVVKAEELRELDTSELAITDEQGKRTSIQRYRDVIRFWSSMETNGQSYVIIGLEGQSRVHYAMPVRTMLYDAIRYWRQVEDVGKRRKGSEGTRKGESDAEFLSEFGKEDTIPPVITIVVFFSAEEWDGPRSLREMIHTPQKEVLPYVQDYGLNLIEPFNMGEQDFARFRTDFGKVMRYIHCSEDKEKMAQIQKDPEFTEVDGESARIINLVTGSRLKFGNGREEKVDMCKGIDGLREESRQEGMREGIKIGKEEGREEGREEGISLSLRNLMDAMNLSVEQALTALKVPVEHWPKYKSNLSR